MPRIIIMKHYFRISKNCLGPPRRPVCVPCVPYRWYKKPGDNVRIGERVVDVRAYDVDGWSGSSRMISSANGIIKNIYDSPSNDSGCHRVFDVEIH